MGLRIHTNQASQRAQRSLETNRSTEAKASDHLASGSRISKAGDDAAGLSISSTLNAHIRSSKQAIRNANDGISMVQVAEGSLQAIGNILIRFRELGIQAASDTIGDSERNMINKEIHQMRDQITQIAHSTEYQGKKLLNGGGAWPTFDVQIGIHGEQDSRKSIDRRGFNINIEHLGLYGIDFSTKDMARGFLRDIDRAMNFVSGYRATLGSIQNHFLAVIDGLDSSVENLSSENSRIKDADIALETSEMAKGQILSQASTSVLTQANQSGNLALKLLG